MKLTETQLKKYIAEALNEYAGSAEAYSRIGAALEKCSVHGLSGEKFVEMIADAAEEKAKYEFVPDYGEDEGICNVEVTVDGSINDIGGDFPAEIFIEASIVLDCYKETDRGDYWTPPYSETLVSGCKKAILNIYYDEENVYEGDITYELDSMLRSNRKRLNEEEQSVIRKVYSGTDPQEARAVLNDVRKKFGFGPYDSYVEGNDVYVEVSKDPTNDSFLYDMLNSLNDYQKNYKMVAEQKKRAVRLNEARLHKIVAESIKNALMEKYNDPALCKLMPKYSDDSMRYSKVMLRNLDSFFNKCEKLGLSSISAAKIDDDTCKFTATFGNGEIILKGTAEHWYEQEFDDSFIRYNEMIRDGKTYPMQCEYEGSDGGIHRKIGDYLFEKYWETKW